MTPDEIKAAEKETTRLVLKQAGIWALIVVAVFVLGIIGGEPIGNYIINLFK